MSSRKLKEATAYILGSLGFLHELFIQQGDRPFLLTASLALMGFPLVFRSEESFVSKKNTKSNGSEGS